MSISSYGTSQTHAAEIKPAGRRKGGLTRRGLLLLLLISCLVLPGVPIPGFLTVRPEEILLLVLAPLVLARMRPGWTKIDLCFGLIGLSTLISMAWGEIALGVLFTPRDVMELVKLARAWLFFRVALYPWSERDLGRAVNVLLVGIGVSALVGIVQWRNWGGIGTLTEAIYVTGTGNEGGRRMIGTVGNANYYALLLGVGLTFALNWWAHSSRRLLLVILIGISGLAVVMTGSRSGVLGVILAIASSVFLRVPWLRYVATWRSMGRNWVFVALAIVLLVVAGTWFGVQYQKFQTMDPVEAVRYGKQNALYRLAYRLSEAENSLNTRIELMWKPNLDIILQSLWLGSGPGKSEFRAVTDNGYVLTLRRYGLVGMLLFFLLLWQVFRALRRASKCHARGSVPATIALAVVAVEVGFLGANLFLETFYHLQLMALFWLLVGVGVSAAHRWPRPQSASQDEDNIPLTGPVAGKVS
jgi:hypothetical protein